MGSEPRIINQSFCLSAALVFQVPPPFGVGMTRPRYLALSYFLVIPTPNAAEESRSDHRPRTPIHGRILRTG